MKKQRFDLESEVDEKSFARLKFNNPYIYSYWDQMLRQCYDPKHHRYSKFGAHGITVHTAWRYDRGRGFRNFIRDTGRRPSQSMTLELKNLYGNFHPGNLIWMRTKQGDMPEMAAVKRTLMDGMQ